MLTALQQRLAVMIAELPESEGFVLAGAGAMLVHGLIDRSTLDLDFFGSPSEEAQVQILAAALEHAVTAAGMACVRRRDLPSFVRLEVSDHDHRCEIDLAVDYRALGVQNSPYGPTWPSRSLPPTRYWQSSIALNHEISMIWRQ
ncbi:MAG: nucleotidyl transferase AbiEii/AbiGii toxin family protein [Egibacteraceae bacterium]